MSNRFQLRHVGCLLILASIVQICVVARNRVPAQDAITFIQFARQLDHHPVVDVLRSHSQHPLYPLLVWMHHRCVGRNIGGDDSSWVRSAQVVAAFGCVLLVIPMYFAGVRLGNASLATGATALATLLPFTARLGADAVADSTYLFLIMTALWMSVEFLTAHRIAWLLGAGLASGLGYLTRPEALFLPIALATTILVVQLRAEWRMPWRRALLGATCGIVGLACIAVPYALTIGKLTPKGSLKFLPGGTAIYSRFDTSQGRPVARTLSDGQPVRQPVAKTVLPPPPAGRLDFALKHRSDEDRRTGYGAAAIELVRELIEGMHYVLGMLVLLGILCAERKPANVLVSILAIVFLIVLLQFASRSGYVASRHVVTLISLACFAASRGGWVFAGFLARGCERFRRPGMAVAILDSRQAWMAAGVLLIAGIICLPRSLGPIHASRAAHLAAGHWLATQARPGSIVLDSRGWASLYSGLSAYDYHGARLAFEDPELSYVVIERSELGDDRPRGQTLRHLLNTAGKKVAEFPAQPAGESVQIYEWQAEHLAGSTGMAISGTRAN